MVKEKKTQKRMIFNIEEGLHRIIKMHAAFRGISITEWLRIAIGQRIDEENKYK